MATAVESSPEPTPAALVPAFYSMHVSVSQAGLAYAMPPWPQRPVEHQAGYDWAYFKGKAHDSHRDEPRIAECFCFTSSS